METIVEEADTTAPKSAGYALSAWALLLFAAGMIAAVVVGTKVGATMSARDDYSTLTEIPGDGLEKAFNWLLFLLVAGPTLVATAVLATGARIANVVADT